jgi:hypothetical protein
VKHALRRSVGLDQARQVCLALACNVKARAVTDRCADEREAEGDIDGSSEIDRLDRDEPWS